MKWWRGLALDVFSMTLGFIIAVIWVGKTLDLIPFSNTILWCTLLVSLLVFVGGDDK